MKKPRSKVLVQVRGPRENGVMSTVALEMTFQDLVRELAEDTELPEFWD